MDRAKFFGAADILIFNRRMSAAARQNLETILDFWDAHYIAAPVAQLAYVMATVRAEVGLNMTPVRETFAATDSIARKRLANRPYGKPVPPYDQVYYGRGYVQLTWKSNYEKQEKRLGQPLVKEPDLVLEAAIAIDILFTGMFSGTFNGQGHGLAYYVDDKHQDFVNARRTVNVLDRAQEIAGFADNFLDALRRGSMIVAAALDSGDGSEDASETLEPSIEHLAAQYEFLHNELSAEAVTQDIAPPDA